MGKINIKNISEIKAIFWDNDGVLVDTEYLYYLANKDICNKNGFELTVPEYQKISLQEGGSIFEPLASEGITQEQIAQWKLDRNNRFGELIIENRNQLLIEGAKEIIEKFKEKNILQAIVTSCRPEHFKLIHQHTGLLELLDFILMKGDYERSKPNPDPYLSALKKSGFLKDQCLVVEDTERGLQAAIAAGIKCIVIPHKLTKNGNFDGAYKILGNIKELEDIVIQK